MTAMFSRAVELGRALAVVCIMAGAVVLTMQLTPAVQLTLAWVGCAAALLTLAAVIGRVAVQVVHAPMHQVHAPMHQYALTPHFDGESMTQRHNAPGSRAYLSSEKGA